MPNVRNRWHPAAYFIPFKLFSFNCIYLLTLTRKNTNIHTSKRNTGNKKMKAIFKGYTSVDHNAFFAIEHKKKIGGRELVVSSRHLELKDGINADNFYIGVEYDVTNLIKE